MWSFSALNVNETRRSTQDASLEAERLDVLSETSKEMFTVTSSKKETHRLNWFTQKTMLDIIGFSSFSQDKEIWELLMGKQNFF